MKTKKIVNQSLPLVVSLILTTLFIMHFYDILVKWTYINRPLIHLIIAITLLVLYIVKGVLFILKLKPFINIKLTNISTLLVLKGTVIIVLPVLFFSLIYQKDNFINSFNSLNSKYLLEFVLMLLVIICSYMLLFQSSNRLKINNSINTVTSTITQSNNSNAEKKHIKFKTLSKEEIELIIKEFSECLPEYSLEDFTLFITDKNISNKIIWYGGKAKAKVKYVKLFHLMHLILENGDKKFKKSQRKEMLNLLMRNFKKEEDSEQIDLNFESMNGAYTNFGIKKYNLSIRKLTTNFQ